MRKVTGEITVLKDDFGFLIDPEEHQRFFHKSFVRGITFDDLEIGDHVQFTPFVGPRGRRAEDVERIPRKPGERKS